MQHSRTGCLVYTRISGTGCPRSPCSLPADRDVGGDELVLQLACGMQQAAGLDPALPSNRPVGHEKSKRKARQHDTQALE